MSKARVTIIPKKKAIPELSRLSGKGFQCYFLCEDRAFLVKLRKAFDGKIQIHALEGMFDRVLQDKRPQIIRALARLNKDQSSYAWWGSQIASRSSSATPLIANIVYFMCAKNILVEHEKLKDSSREDAVNDGVIFITESRALNVCIEKEAKEHNCDFENKDHLQLIFMRMARQLRYWAQTIYFFKLVYQDRIAINKYFNPLPSKRSEEKKRVVIRSWVTMGNFDSSEKFSDRNFGQLPEWLSTKGYEVWTLPIFFNISMQTDTLYKLLKKQDMPFLFPVQYLKFSDYVDVIRQAYELGNKRVGRVDIDGLDVSPIVQEVLSQGLYVYLLFYNLCGPMLKRLKNEHYEIDGFYYPFESNPPEKQFILSCREHFPNAKIIGFQHTTFFLNQLAYSLDAQELDVHPLPDRIICSGPIYVELYKNAGFPEEMLVEGCNLRYHAVHKKIQQNDVPVKEEKLLLLPLTFSYELAFDVIEKVQQAVSGKEEFRICIRNHPLLSRQKLKSFIKEIGLKEFDFADTGGIQEWFSRCFAMITTGGSITTVEAAAAGLPVIRVIADNTFHLDAFVWPDYPLEPVTSAEEIARQLALIADLRVSNDDVFTNLAGHVHRRYFTKPSEDNLNVFLPIHELGELNNKNMSHGSIHENIH